MKSSATPDSAERAAAAARRYAELEPELDEDELADLLGGAVTAPGSFAGIATQHEPVSLHPAVVEPERRRVRVADTDFDDVTMPQAVDRILWMSRQSDRPRHVCTGNLDHLVHLQQDPEFREAYRTADLVLADGMPVLWLSRLRSCRSRLRGVSARVLRERVAGSDLFWELGHLSARTGVRLFFLGGAPGAADRAAEALQSRYPGVRVCGTYCPPYETFGTEAEERRIAAAVNSAAPHILLVGLGAPKQEKWILANKSRVPVPVSIGVGGSFEMAGGLVRRAPQWMQRSGLEWSYRLLQDPRRLSRRYLCQDLPYFVALVAGALAAGAS